MGKDGKLRENLKKYEISVDASSKTYQHLLMIDDVLQQMESRQSEAKKYLKKTLMSISSVAKAAGIARGTIYNNKVLRDYIESFAEDHSDAGIYDECERLQKNLDEANQEIELLVQRDVDAMMYAKKIKELEQENAALRKSIEKLNDRIKKIEENSEGEKTDYYS